MPTAKKVLVTGGTGFVGSHLVELLLQKGYSVVCLVRDPSRIRWLKGLDVTLVKGDCTRPESLENALKNVSIVFHVAGVTRAKRKSDYYDVNYTGTKNLLEACARTHCTLEKFVFVSSAAASGPSLNGVPLKEEETPLPLSDYGRSKLLAEEEVLSYKNRFPVVIFRPPFVYGPRDENSYKLFRSAKMGIFFEIGRQEKFFEPCYVDDLTAALLSAAEKEISSGSIYFVAEKRPYSWSEFRQLLSTTVNVKGRNVKIPFWIAYLIGLTAEIVSLFSSQPAFINRKRLKEYKQKRWVFDLKKIEADLGFRAAYPFKKGLEITWKWVRENGWH